MCSEFECTVWEVLQRKPFQDAKVLAGGNGLSQKVSGACLLEQAQFEEINSGDILITSGSGLNLDAPGGQANIRKMLKKSRWNLHSNRHACKRGFLGSFAVC